MAHSIDHEVKLTGHRGEDFIVRPDELTPLQNKMMDLAAMVHRLPPYLNN